MKSEQKVAAAGCLLGSSSASGTTAMMYGCWGPSSLVVGTMDDLVASHLAAACSRSAVHQEAFFPLREAFPHSKLLR